MSLARAVTKRIKRSDGAKVPTSPLPSRSPTVKSPTAFDRSKISLPVALVSTTNMLSYNAPNLNIKPKEAPAPIVTSPLSEDDSDHSVSGRSRASSHSSRHTAFTDASSVDGSPTSPAPNHLSGFFPPPKQLRKSASTTSLHQVKEEAVEEPVPALPKRALSHSKKAHERLARNRSVHNISTTTSITKSASTHRKSREQRSSVDIFRGAATEPEAHPFDRELKQLNEVAEEFSGAVRDAEAEADLLVMRTKNLATFCAADYLAEIRPLFSARFGTAQLAWI